MKASKKIAYSIKEYLAALCPVTAGLVLLVLFAGQLVAQEKYNLPAKYFVGISNVTTGESMHMACSPIPHNVEKYK